MAITLHKAVIAREDQVAVTVAPAALGLPRRSVRRFIGAGHVLFGSARAIDEPLDRQRDEWAF